MVGSAGVTSQACTSGVCFSSPPQCWVAALGGAMLVVGCPAWLVKHSGTGMLCPCRSSSFLGTAPLGSWQQWCWLLVGVCDPWHDWHWLYPAVLDLPLLRGAGEGVIDLEGVLSLISSVAVGFDHPSGQQVPGFCSPFY